MNICRFCHDWKTKESSMVMYGPRYWAHLKCLESKGRLKEVLEKMPLNSLEQLPYFELKELGMLNFVEDLATQKRKRNGGSND